MTAGRRDALITLQRFTATQDEYGEEVKAWTDLAKEWAAIFYGRGDERRQAAMEQGIQPATFQILSNDITRSIKLTDRIVFDSNNWDIKGISPDTPRRGSIEVTAVRAA